MQSCDEAHVSQICRGLSYARGPHPIPEILKQSAVAAFVLLRVHEHRTGHPTGALQEVAQA